MTGRDSYPSPPAVLVAGSMQSLVFLGKLVRGRDKNNGTWDKQKHAQGQKNKCKRDKKNTENATGGGQDGTRQHGIPEVHILATGGINSGSFPFCRVVASSEWRFVRGFVRHPLIFETV